MLEQSVDRPVIARSPGAEGTQNFLWAPEFQMDNPGEILMN